MKKTLEKVARQSAKGMQAQKSGGCGKSCGACRRFMINGLEPLHGKPQGGFCLQASKGNTLLPFCANDLKRHTTDASRPACGNFSAKLAPVSAERTQSSTAVYAIAKKAIDDYATVSGSDPRAVRAVPVIGSVGATEDEVRPLDSTMPAFDLPAIKSVQDVGKVACAALLPLLPERMERLAGEVSDHLGTDCWVTITEDGGQKWCRFVIHSVYLAWFLGAAAPMGSGNTYLRATGLALAMNWRYEVVRVGKSKPGSLCANMAVYFPLLDGWHVEDGVMDKIVAETLDEPIGPADLTNQTDQQPPTASQGTGEPTLTTTPA